MIKIEPRLLKGFRDFSPNEQAKRQAMFQKIQGVFERYGFLPLATPALEYKDILLGKIGEDEKLIYSFKDNGDRDVAMRYDLTVPLARYVAQNQGQLVLPFKRYQIAPVWRADNPQRGRFREFYQCDVDVVGSKSLLADAEVIACLCKALETLGLKNYKVRLNDRQTMANLSVLAIRALDKFEKIGVDGVVAEMKEKGLGEDEIDKVKLILEAGNAPSAPDTTTELMGLLADLGVAGDKVVFDPIVARGLDYYTGTVFETVLPDKPEFGSICSGGRYDNLVDQFSNQSLPAVGGSIGIDRLIEAMSQMDITQPPSPLTALVLNLDEKLTKDYIKLVSDLRQEGINTEFVYESVKLDKQFKYAENKNVRYTVIMGDKELATGTIQVKDVVSREQTELKREELSAFLKK
jgi:histidyl-tRNA synthetase